MSVQRARQRRISLIAASLSGLAALASLAAPGAAFAATTTGVTGTVTDSVSSAGIANAQVTLYQGSNATGFSTVATTQTDGVGAYSFSVAAGTYEVGFQASDHVRRFYKDTDALSTATAVTVADGATTTANQALAPGTAFSGQVVDNQTGSTISGVNVQLLHLVVAANGTRSWPNAADPALKTDASGKWSTVVPANGVNYKIQYVTPSGYGIDFGRNQYDVDDAAQQPSGSPTPVDVGVERLYLAATLSGHIYDSQHAGLGGATVTILYPHGSTEWRTMATATTAADGSYAVNVAATRPTGLSPYRIRVQKTGYGTVYYSSSSTAGTTQVGSASDVNPGEKETISGLDIAAPVAGVLTGQVKVPTGVDVTDGVVRVFQYTTATTGGVTHTSWVQAPSDAPEDISVASDGTYTVTLTAGQYRIAYFPNTDAPVFYGGGRDLDKAADITVTTSQTIRADIVVPNDGAVAGRVTVDGKQEPNATLTAVAPYVSDVQDGVARTSDWAVAPAHNTSALDGSYSLSLAPGAWYVKGTQASPGTYSAYYPSAANEVDATKVNVTTGSTASAIDIELHNTTVTSPQYRVIPTISGTVDAGKTLTADPGVFVPNSATIAYQWYSCIPDSNGICDPPNHGTPLTPISGATGQTYTIPTSGSAGKHFVVAVAVTKTGLSTPTTTRFSSDTTVSGSKLTMTDAVPKPCSLPIGCTAPTPESSPTNSAAPTINGTVAVGQTLTVSPGTYSPTGGAYQYQWFATGASGATAPITNANYSTFQPTTAEQGSQLSVKVWYTVGGLSVTATSARTTPVAAPVITLVTAPTISGTPAVDQILTANGGQWNPSGTSQTFQWYADSAAITGATGQTYTVGSGDVGKQITVKVTASKAGWTSANATSAPTAAVAQGTLTNSSAPSVSGDPVVGNTLTANPGTWTPTPDALAYQWLADGAPISGATSTTYVVVSGDIGKHISVRVTGTKAGYRDLTVSSAATAPVHGTITNSAAPSVSGDPVLGKTLTADPGTWSPTPDALAYQWLADGAPISGATSTTYVVSSGDIGRQVSVRVTASKSGYRDLAVSSAATAPATSGAPAPRPITVTLSARNNSVGNDALAVTAAAPGAPIKIYGYFYGSWRQIATAALNSSGHYWVTAKDLEKTKSNAYRVFVGATATTNAAWSNITGLV